MPAVRRSGHAGKACAADRRRDRRHRLRVGSGIGRSREYLFISVCKACAESLASDLGSRLAAMQRSEENIATLSANLGQTFHRLRQSSIDEGLFDVTTGFNALSSEDTIAKVRAP
jgi:hypothetical protein